MFCILEKQYQQYDQVGYVEFNIIVEYYVIVFVGELVVVVVFVQQCFGFIEMFIYLGVVFQVGLSCWQVQFGQWLGGVGGWVGGCDGELVVVLMYGKDCYQYGDYQWYVDLVCGEVD